HANPCRRANEIVSATSSGVAHKTMARGRTSWKRALNGAGNSWSAGEPGRTTFPAIPPCSACQLGNDPVMAAGPSRLLSQRQRDTQQAAAPRFSDRSDHRPLPLSPEEFLTG